MAVDRVEQYHRVARGSHVVDTEDVSPTTRGREARDGK